MPCQGPSKEFAVIKSQEAFDELIQLMKDKYQVERPDFIEGDLGIYKKWQEDWDKDEEVLRETLASLFWHSDAASF